MTGRPEAAAAANSGGPSDAQTRFEALVRAYARLISHAISRVGRQRVALIKEDIEQRVLVALWRQVQNEQVIEKPDSYIYKAAVRETVRSLRREMQRQENEEAGPPPAPRPADDPHRALGSREQAATLKACIEGLTPDRRRAVRAQLAGFAVSEMMASYGWSYQKARNLVARGMSDLREALRSRGIHG